VKKTAWQNIDDVFSGGAGFDLWWFVPTEVPKAVIMEKEFS